MLTSAWALSVTNTIWFYSYLRWKSAKCHEKDPGGRIFGPKKGWKAILSLWSLCVWAKSGTSQPFSSSIFEIPRIGFFLVGLGFQ
jgi:hypothetical protein